MNVNVGALNKAMDLSGSRLIAPQHYAQAARLTWYAARTELRKLAECGFLTEVKYRGRRTTGKFRVHEFSVDD